MKVYDTKAWVVRDSIEYNPFVSDYLLFSDAGLFSYDDPPWKEAWVETEKMMTTLWHNQVPNVSIVISQVDRLKPGSHRC